MGNVSCFILDENAHGYYLHGRSVHAFSDTTMAGMNAYLKAEQDKLTAKRGLVPDTELQEFEIYLTPRAAEELRQLYFFLIHQERTSPNSMAGTTLDAFLKVFAFRQTVPAENIVKAHKAMTAFLKGIIEHTDKTHNYNVVQEKEALHKFLGIPPNLAISPQSLFFPEKSGFTSVLMMGVEYDMVLWGLYIFTLVTFFSLNPIAGLFTAFFCEAIFSKLRSTFGERNLAYKTLADKRFLI